MADAGPGPRRAPQLPRGRGAGKGGDSPGGNPWRRDPDYARPASAQRAALV